MPVSKCLSEIAKKDHEVRKTDFRAKSTKEGLITFGTAVRIWRWMHARSPLVSPTPQHGTIRLTTLASSILEGRAYETWVFRFHRSWRKHGNVHQTAVNAFGRVSVSEIDAITDWKSFLKTTGRAVSSRDRSQSDLRSLVPSLKRLHK